MKSSGVSSPSAHSRCESSLPVRASSRRSGPCRRGAIAAGVSGRLRATKTRVLWFNDIEEGFNVSRFERAGEIRSTEYWCNQDPLERALPLLQGKAAVRLGPQTPIR